ncbi:MAG: hypothetical protein R2697_20070 [Ilumatobacteraceae bacterium]
MPARCATPRSDVLVFDTEYFTERARRLGEQFPDLVLLGFGPNAAGDATSLALADTFELQRPSGPPDLHLDDLCTVVYTGGTTGRPEGVPDEPASGSR